MRREVAENVRAIGARLSGLPGNLSVDRRSSSANRSMHNNRLSKTFVGLLAVLATALLLAGCGGGGDSTEGSDSSGAVAGTPGDNPQSGGTLNIYTALPLESLDQFASPPTADTALTFVLESLVEIKPGTTEVVPSLAESWEVSDDGKTYTFQLRPGVKFSNGTPLTSADVVYSLELWKKIKLEISPDCCENLTKIESPSEGVVRLDFSKPAPNLLLDLAWNPAALGGIMDSKLREKIGAEAYAKDPVGTGPFKIVSFRSGEAKLVRNELYWRDGLPYLDGINIKVVEDPNTRILSVKSGEAQVATGIPYDQTTPLENDPSGTLLVQNPWSAVYTVFINNDQKPLSETPVRRALSYASDRETILQNALNGLGSIANSAAVSFGAYDKSVKQLPYDLGLAEEELKKSSVAGGFSLEILVQSGDTTGGVTAAILQDSFKKIGIQADIRKVDSGTYISDFVAGKYDLAVGPFDWWPGTIGESGPQYTLLFASPAQFNTFTWYENPEAEKMAKQLAVTPDGPERLALASELQKISVEDPPILGLAFLTNASFVGKEVCNFQMRPVTRVTNNSAEVYLAPEC